MSNERAAWENHHVLERNGYRCTFWRKSWNDEVETDGRHATFVRVSKSYHHYHQLLTLDMSGTNRTQFEQLLWLLDHVHESGQCYAKVKIREALGCI